VAETCRTPAMFITHSTLKHLYASVVCEKDQQDAHFSHYFIPIKISTTCFEQTSSSSGD